MQFIDAAAQAAQSSVQTFVAQLQSNTQLTVQDRTAQAQAALASVNNLSAQAIAHINADTSLSVADKQTQSAQIIAGLNNASAQAVQQLVNAGSLANIAANGVVNTNIQQITNDNKILLQTSQGAAALYAQALTNLSAIMTNPNLSTDQQSAALNNGVAQLRDGLAALSAIAANTQATSTLVFGNPAAAPPAAAPAPLTVSPDQAGAAPPVPGGGAGGGNN